MFVFKATFGRSLVSPDQMQQQRGPCGTVWQRRNYSVKMTRGTKMMMWKRWTDMHSNQMHTQSERSMGLATESWSCSCQSCRIRRLACVQWIPVFFATLCEIWWVKCQQSHAECISGLSYLHLSALHRLRLVLLCHLRKNHTHCRIGTLTDIFFQTVILMSSASSGIFLFWKVPPTDEGICPSTVWWDTYSTHCWKLYFLL